jgi:hypothetical protein
MSDSVAFSCCIDLEYATLWVHWTDQSSNSPVYVSTHINICVFRDPAQLVEFRKNIKNIIDYGLDQCLAKVNQALDEISRFDPEWTEHAESVHPPGVPNDVVSPTVSALKLRIANSRNSHADLEVCHLALLLYPNTNFPIDCLELF